MSDDQYSHPQAAEAMANSPLADTHVELSHDDINDDSVYKNPILGPNTSKLHAVMVPYPLQGHINPMVQFAKVLITHHNFIVTFVNNQHNHKRIQETRSKSTQYNGADDVNYCLRFVWVDNGLPPDFDYSDLVSTHQRRQDFHAGTLNMEGPLKGLVKSLIDKKSPPLTCIVFGSFCPWAHRVAVELNIPNVFFWSQSASVFSIYYHAPMLASHGFFPYKMTAPGTDNMVSYIPGVPPLHPASFPTFLHIDDLNNIQFKPIKEQFETLQNCDAVIINSYHELEREACQALLSVPFPVSFVGPLLPSAFLDGSEVQDTSVGASLLQDNSDCIRWLDGQQKQSVLYISFGSVFCPPADDLHSIALGIKACEQPFLWVIRSRSCVQNVSDILPDKFLEETKDYGMFIAWAPQLQVLSHPSVGAFLTHCGWNSTLESLSMGVPMIPFPIASDQTTNCTFVVDIWKVGLSIQRQDDGKVGIGEVAAVVKTLFHREEGREMRRKAGQLREAARRAVQAEGSSSVHIKNFVQTIIRCGAN